MTNASHLTTPGTNAGLRATWTRAHQPFPGVPRWATIAAYSTALTVLPSSVWRILVFALHVPISSGSLAPADSSSGVPGLPIEVYVVVLSIVSELAAFTAVGLVAHWGEVFPGWIPGLGGRRVPVLAAVVPATLGTLVLTLLWTWSAANLVIGRTMTGQALATGFPLNVEDWQGVLAIAAYAPLLAWGPLLGAVTVAYYRRRA